MIQETTINESYSGFDIWICGEYGSPMLESEWSSSVLDQGIEYFELGKDNLPPDIKDIRGHIYNQPERVFALRHPSGEITYIGLRGK